MKHNNKKERSTNPPMQKLSNGIAIKERKPNEGQGGGKPIVFLHGSGFDSTVFDNQFNSDVLSQHHLIAMDLPGHGQSDDAGDPRNEYSYAAMGAKVLDALSLMNISSAIFVGWSLGGQIAIEIHEDERVEGVFAFGVAPIAPGPMGLIRGFHFSRDLLLASKAQFNVSEAQRFETACLGAQSTGQFVDAIMRTDPALRPAMSKMVLKGQGLDQKQAIEAPAKPMCLLLGENDPFIRSDYLKSLDTMGLFTKEVIMLRGSGHAPFMDDPESFDLSVLDFADWVEFNGFAFDRALMNVSKAA